jgi:hypothetical protein
MHKRCGYSVNSGLGLVLLLEISDDLTIVFEIVKMGFRCEPMLYLPLWKVRGCYSFCFSWSPTSIGYIYTQKLCCTSKYTMEHQKHWTSHHGYRKCMFVDSSIEYRGHPTYVSPWSVELIKVGDVVRPLPKHVSLWCLFFDLHLAKHRLNIGV